MRLTKFSHACVRIDADGAVLVVDPGIWAEPAALDGVDAVLITHEHADHLKVDLLADALAKRPQVRIYTHPEVVPKLGELSEVTTTVNSGESFEAAGLRVSAHGGVHAEIHPDLPRVANLGFVIDERIYHPGDSFDIPDGVQVETVFVPVSAPWLRLAESIDFVRALGARHAYPLHDDLLNDHGHELVTTLMGNLTSGYARVRPGEAFDG